ncbi:hypothetical protein [Roseibium sp.]
MIGFSSRTLSTIEGFAANMQIDRVSAADDGSLTFQFERAGTLCFTPSQDGSRTLISLKRKPARPLLAEHLKDLLALSGWDSYLRLTINAGLSIDDSPVIVASLDEQTLDLQSIEHCLDRLISLHDRMQIN